MKGIASSSPAKEWKRRESGDLKNLQEETGLSFLTLQACLSRGLKNSQQIQDFLAPRLENLKSPWILKDMDRGVSRISEARDSHQKIRIYGDYDVDGTAGAALLSWVFRDLKFNFDARQPDRFLDGYGLNSKAVEEAHKEGVNVLVTVDCGITSFDAAIKAKELGIDLIVIDHHQVDPEKGLPDAYAVINPQRKDCESELKQLCGCGLAFYFSIALRAYGRKNNWFLKSFEPNLKQHLDLVVIATAADMVPLTGDNHILVRYGLEVLKQSKKPGVQALLEVAGLATKEISPSHLGFTIGPRINASGRMQSASLALELLTTQNSDRAQTLAKELENLNQERANLQNAIWDEVRLRVESEILKGNFQHGVVIADSNWHEGVIGIVASRVTEFFRKPAIILSLRDDYGKGSVRSYAGKDVLEGLRMCSHLLIGFGGHKHAAGLSLALDQVENFAKAFDEAMSKLSIETHGGSLWIEGSCLIEDFDVKTLQELENLGPFGPGNPEPIFTLKALVKEHRVLKGRHLKLRLSEFENKNGLEAIWFNGAEVPEVLPTIHIPEEREWAGVPELNRFRGQITPTLRIRDWRKIYAS